MSQFSQAQLIQLSQLVAQAVSTHLDRSVAREHAGGVDGSTISQVSSVDSGVPAVVKGSHVKNQVVDGDSVQRGKVESVPAGDVAVGGLYSGGDSDSGSDSTTSVVSVEMPKKEVSPGVSGLIFGGVEEGCDVTKGYYAIVRSANVKRFSKFLAKFTGLSFGSKVYPDLALVSFSAGTMPLAFRDGKGKLKQLEALGDAALALCVVEDAVRGGRSVSSAQAVKSDVLSNSMLTSICVNSGIADFVSFPPGVSPGSAKTGANAIEALAGVCYVHYGMVGVGALAVALGVVSARK